MSDTSWKAFERRIAKRFGGERRGADFRGASGGKNDIIKEGWSIEVKLLSRPSFGQMSAAFDQAVGASEPGDIPIAIIKKKFDADANAIVVMKLDEFMEWFGDFGGNG